MESIGSKAYRLTNDLLSTRQRTAFWHQWDDADHEERASMVQDLENEDESFLADLDRDADRREHADDGWG